MPEHPAPETPESPKTSKTSGSSELGNPEAVEQERNAVEPQADGTTAPVDSPTHEPASASEDTRGEADSYAPADSHSDEQAIGTAADEVLIDGRLSGLPPNYDTDTTPEGADSPGLDAEIQRDAGSDSGDEDR